MVRNKKRLNEHRVNGPGAGAILSAPLQAVVPELQLLLIIALPQPAVMRSDSTRISTHSSLAHVVLPATPRHHPRGPMPPPHGIRLSSTALATPWEGQGRSLLRKQFWRIWRREEWVAVTTPLPRTSHHLITPHHQCTCQGTILLLLPGRTRCCSPSWEPGTITPQQRTLTIMGLTTLTQQVRPLRHVLVLPLIQTNIRACWRWSKRHLAGHTLD
mmetsp:Transcript_29920/g.55016  ORF Transcript_29920/g.55016 Transcript_29920/m.55016 type:complete len:215 (+) Transcript_29920:176-820(+)